MKSKLFINNPTTSKEFSKDLRVVTGIKATPEFFAIFPKCLSRYAMARDSKAETETLEELRALSLLTQKEMSALLGLGGFILGNIAADDTVDDIMEDFKTIAAVEESKLPSLRPYIEVLLKISVSEFETQKITRSTQTSGLNVITAITHLLDLRPVVKNRLESGDEIEDYDPHIVNLVPVAILRLRLSDKKECVFQMTSYSLKLLQDELEAIKKELASATAFVGSEKIAEY